MSNLDSRINLHIIVVADNCSDGVIDAVSDVFCKCELYRVSLGNAKSFCKCIDIGTDRRLADDDIIFMLEDDYLFLDDNVFSKMTVAFS